MNYRMLLVRAAFCGVGMVGYASAGVINGGFEDGFTGWTQFGDTSFTGVTGSSSANCGGMPLGNCATHSGLSAAFFGNTDSGGITQSVATVQGATYLVEFWLAVGMDGKDPNSSQYTVSLGSTILDVVDPALDPVWRYVHFSAVAEGTNSLLSFGFRDDRDTFGLDDVNVTFSAAPVAGTATPEPASMILAGTSLIALAGLSRLLRRSRR